MKEKKLINRWIVVLGAVCMQLCLGAVYAWSLFNQPLINKFGWEASEVVLTFSITIATGAIFTIIAGKVQDKIGPRWVATTGGIILGIGLFLASQATTLTQLYLFYGLIGGIGIGTAYMCPLATCVKWFPDMRGLISGIAVAGFGAGSLLFKPVILHFIGTYGVSEAFLYLGIIYMTVIVISAQFLLVPPPGYKPEGWEPPVTSANTGGNDFTTGEMLKTWQFYIIWTMYFFGCIAGLMVISIAADIGIRLVGLDPVMAGNAVVTLALFNAFGRILWGTMSDRFGRLACLIIIYLIAASAMFGMSSIEMNYIYFLALVSTIGFCFGGFLSIFPSLTADYYGTVNMGGNYGVLFLSYGLAAIIGPVIATSLIFTQAFLVSAVLCLIAAGLSLIAKPPIAPEQTIAA